jgi:hypothetical protein
VVSSAKIPDVIVHDATRNWLLFIEAVTRGGPVDGRRRKELKDRFAGCQAGLVFITAFENRRAMQRFVSQFAWESEVWIADDPNHMIHFNGERFLGPYPDVMAKKSQILVMMWASVRGEDRGTQITQSTVEQQRREM